MNEDQNPNSEQAVKDKMVETFGSVEEVSSGPAQPVATSAPDPAPTKMPAEDLAADGDQVVGGVDEE